MDPAAVAILAALIGAGGVAGGMASVQTGPFVSAARNLSNLSNLGGMAGFGLGEVVVGGAETTLTKSPNGETIVTQTTTAGLGGKLGLGLIAEGHAGMSQTAVFIIDPKTIDAILWSILPRTTWP